MTWKLISEGRRVFRLETHPHVSTWRPSLRNRALGYKGKANLAKERKKGKEWKLGDQFLKAVEVIGARDHMTVACSCGSAVEQRNWFPKKN